MDNIIPKKENENIGFWYTATDEQIAKHKTLSTKELFVWIQAGNEFLAAIQTPQERANMRAIKGKPIADFS